MLCGTKLQLVPAAEDKWTAGTEAFFLAKEKGWALNWLEVPAIYTCLSEVHTENLLKAGVVKSSCHCCLPSYDLTVEGQAGCSTCGRISGTLAVIGSIPRTHSPEREN